MSREDLAQTGADNYFSVDILLLSGSLLKAQVTQATFSTRAGEVSVLAYHAPYVFYLEPGFIVLEDTKKDKESKPVFISGGLALFSEKNTLTFLAREAYLWDTIPKNYFEEQIAFYREKLDHGEEEEKVFLGQQVEALQTAQNAFNKSLS